MKRQVKNIIIPINIWESADLTPTEKIVLCDIDTYTTDGETSVGAQAIASSCGLTAKEVKASLKSLQEKGAISVRLAEDGEKLITPYLYKERYISSPDNAVKIGTTPTDIQPLPWDEITEKWAEICPTLPKITRWSPQRKSKVRSTLKQAGLSVEDLYKIFRIVAVTPFLNGTSNQFSAHFDWIVSKSQNAQKIYEGYYCKSYQEKRDYELIMRGDTINQQSQNSDDYYR